MGLEFGLQLFSVRDELEKDFTGTLEKLALIGYKNVELFFHGDDLKATIGNLEPASLKKELDRLELKAVSAHIAEEHLEVDKVKEVIEYAKLLGVQSLVIAIAYFKNKEDVLSFSEKLNKYGALLKTHNLQLYYHNHFHEFQKFDGDYVLDLILKNTNEDLLKIEFDTYWALRGGVDPVEYLKKMGGRCDLIHQKDLSTDVDTINLFQKIENDTPLNRDSMIKVRNIADFTEAGQGIMDIPSIIETFRNNPESKYIFIEQDWTKRNQIESVEISYRYLSKFFSV
ncbi:sugar phosphate isomerase/epimerase family protein [Lederbergia lenta]|uniref:Sugar phosphate isomerase/epimerase n=1 Tax=Lederbergia lenta TaxID=1467 RepID=A0A2X4WFT9_LEDLE|nr:sugar phosphate isomerase/epimerase [Lederbergia lenta]MEC2326188.1 sugar phosphate isomerase/epimerase [Lederbergia lenta]SQI63617.1 sugar phosphate isomerase/epimerase [Lederbergia lenta]